ncbi:MAG: segregation/condensation protein A [Elusimicrobiota bacterium]|nr:segregation/condensation protein A [Endomicrobiia bacterium]MCX7910480.1 segregation/condensation protein A [Endomicrobiia bacterium]MDW8165464.1 segregation/condensation protein A [Elusimicrobiota bacterium]
MNQIYEVKLDIFEGPLDLLLYLVKKNNFDIYNIPISEITHQYLEYLDLMKELNLEIAGEFLVMAATLMEIKSKSLLPKPQEELEDEVEQIRKQLVDRLVEYQKYKNVAINFFRPREAIERNVFYRKLPIFSEDDYYIEATIFDLLTALNEVLKRVPAEYKEIVVEEIRIEEKMHQIMEYLKNKKYVLFDELMQLEKTRKGIIVLFLALLELIRLRQVFARQKEFFKEIRIYPMFSVISEEEN